MPLKIHKKTGKLIYVPSWYMGMPILSACMAFFDLLGYIDFPFWLVNLPTALSLLFTLADWAILEFKFRMIIKRAKKMIKEDRDKG